MKLISILLIQAFTWKSLAMSHEQFGTRMMLSYVSVSCANDHSRSAIVELPRVVGFYLEQDPIIPYSRMEKRGSLGDLSCDDQPTRNGQAYIYFSPAVANDLLAGRTPSPYGMNIQISLGHRHFNQIIECHSNSSTPSHTLNCLVKGNGGQMLVVTAVFLQYE